MKTFLPTYIQIFSMGGSGSYFIKSYLDSVVPTSQHLKDVIYDYGDTFANKHSNSPPDKTLFENTCVLYLYCNPLNHALSMYNKKMPVEHCEQMGGDVEGLKNKAQTFNDFIENRIDYFKYYDHLYKWTHSDVQYPIIACKYESLSSTISSILDMFNLKNVSKMPSFKPRTTSCLVLAKDKQEQLRSMFKKELELYNQLEDLTIISK